MIASQAFAAALKEHLAEMFNQPFEARQVMLKPGECAGMFLVEDFTCGNVLCEYIEASHVLYCCGT